MSAESEYKCHICGYVWEAIPPSKCPKCIQQSNTTSDSAVDGPIGRAVAGALKSCIDAHGPITKDFVFSATKRIVRQLESSGLLLK